MARGKYCCFKCPENNWDIKDSTDLCPKCGMPFDFPLAYPPVTIGNYRIVAPIARGFYGAAFQATSGRLGARSVLKVTPVALYAFFKKDFEAESRAHAALAEGSEHVVGIRDVSEEDVTFANGATIRCHVAELEYLNGRLLQAHIDGRADTDASMIAQIAIDLLRMREEFARKRAYHNDLHAENLIVEVLQPNTRRQGALSGSIRVKAIDLGSIADDSKTGQQNRVGDMHWIGDHIHALVGRLLAKNVEIEDREYRMALALQSVAQILMSPPEKARLPNVEDLVLQIEAATQQALQPWRPWRMPLALKSYGDHYNALTLNSWSVPSLLVDPDGSWLKEVAKAGPQIIIGMRGCGKTMLLRALDFHARAVAQTDRETEEQIEARLAKDKYVGLFVPAQRLLDVKEQSLKTTEQHIASLAVYFALQAVRALIHLSEFKGVQISGNSHTLLEEGAFDFLTVESHYRGSTSLQDLEHRLERLAVSTSRSDSKIEITSAPAQVFTRLAEALRRCSTLWQDSQVFFLLDDVSTRYLVLEKIERIFSVLLFSDPICAFKFTSEWQTIELGLRSPGRVNPIRIDRDVAVFDLGSIVHTTVKRRGEGLGKHFVEKILEQRAAHFPGHTGRYSPSQLLGDVTLETIAQDIASSGETSNTRKKVYRGITCLANVCVGDIGDVIKIYEEILKSFDGRKIPIPEAVQSQSFQDISSLRLYDLNRLRVTLMKTAKAFAEAAHELLVTSARESSRGGPVRLRQYSSVYVRVGDGQSEEQGTRPSPAAQVDLLRELIDAGVFVFSGGSPRTKTRDSNPIHQFKLTFRKIYGLANFIGLADRDRFELSGHDLETWLTNAEEAKRILLRNQRRSADDDEEDTLEEAVIAGDAGASEEAPSAVAPAKPRGSQAELSLDLPPSANPTTTLVGVPMEMSVTEFGPDELRQRTFDTVFTAFGFEERVLASNAMLASTVPARSVLAIAYGLPGFAGEILAQWRSLGLEVTQIPYGECLYVAPDLPERALIDITGMAKPAIFHAIRRQLSRYGKVTVCHGAAESYYPLQSDLETLLSAEAADNRMEMLARLSEVLKGEQGPYTPIRLLTGAADVLRKRVLLGYVSPKHERIFELLQLREYDGIELVCGSGDDARSRVTQLVGEVLVKSYENSRVTRINSNKLSELVRHADDTFRALYGNEGASFEIALTGSKLQAVAAAVISARRRVAQVWYVSPKFFDSSRFSRGVGAIKFYDIRLT